MRGPGGASTGGKGSERAIVSGRASAADVFSRIIHLARRRDRRGARPRRHLGEIQEISPP